MILAPSPVLKTIRLNCTQYYSKMTYHFNWIELTMEFRQKNAFMPCLFAYCFKHWWLIQEIFLLAQETSHATSSVFQWTDRWTFCPEPRNIETTLNQDFLKSLGLTIDCCHLLNLTPLLRGWVGLGNNCVILYPLLSTIGFIHIKCSKCTRSQGCMSGRLIENEEGSHTQMDIIMDLYCLSDLHNKLVCVPPRITLWAWVDYLPCISNNIARRPVPSVIKSDTWIRRPRLFFCRTVWPSASHADFI